MTILAKAFFTLVRSHFVPFVLFSVWHNRNNLLFYISFHLVHESFSRFECRDEVLRNNQCGVLRDVAGSFLCSFLGDETTKTSQINIVTS